MKRAACIILVAIAAASANAGTIYDTSNTIVPNSTDSVNTLDLYFCGTTFPGANSIADFGAISDLDADIGWGDRIDSSIWRSILPVENNHDDEYIARVDSAWVIDRIECDTIPRGVYKKNDTTWAESIDIECDTVYIRRLTNIWKPLVTVKLRPEQIEKLKEILQ